MRWLAVALAPLAVVALGARHAAGSGGEVKLKTDNGPDGYYYNALGAAAGRYVAKYEAADIRMDGLVCGARRLDNDNSIIVHGVDAYTHGLDLRASDPNAPEYADLTSAGLLAPGDPNSLVSCSTGAASRTGTFGGGAGVPHPGFRFFITLAQPANNDPANGIDFCGILLDTSSIFANSARTQGYFPGGVKTSIGFNHFVEAVVFEPVDQDVSLRMTGSSRFPGDRGLPVQFARRRCSGSACRISSMDPTDNNGTDDFITARITIDNRLGPATLVLVVEADRSAVNPRLGPRDVLPFFRPIGGGAPVTSPITFPTGRTLLALEIDRVIARRLLARLPVSLPFQVRLEDPNDPNLIPDEESQDLGLRPNTGYYDDDTHSGGFFFTQSPVLSGDALCVRYDAVDLPKPGNALVVSGAQVVGGEFGVTGLRGLDAFELRREDTILPGNPDLSPQGLFRSQGTVGDPGNGDGIPMGIPVTTVSIDLTDYVATPQNPALAVNLFGLAYLNPGDTGAQVTAIGSAGAGDAFIGNSSTLHAGEIPVVPFASVDLEIRLDVEGELGTGAAGRRTRRIEGAVLREPGQYVLVEKGGRRVE
jgi:hypothetical protein